MVQENSLEIVADSGPNSEHEMAPLNIGDTAKLGPDSR
jgi:hypothetical protein